MFNKNVKFEPFEAFLFSFLHQHVNGFLCKGMEDTLFAGVAMHLSARAFYRQGQ